MSTTPRLTPVREAVLNIVRQHACVPITAYNILNELQCGAKVPQTVYRALDYLMAHGLVHKLESMNAYVACQHSNGQNYLQHKGVFLICRVCHETHELDDTSGVDKLLARYAEQGGLNEVQSTVEISGVCEKCRGMEH